MPLRIRVPRLALAPSVTDDLTAANIAAGLATVAAPTLVEMTALRPDSDISVGNWTTDTGATTNLYAAIDEVTANNSDFIRSGPLTPGVPDVVEVGLSNAPDPSTGNNHAVVYRVVKRGPATVNLTIYLMEGATQIASWTINGVSTEIVEGVHILSTAEANAITSYSDLRLKASAVVP